MTFARRYGEWLVRWRWPVLGASLAVLLGLSVLATQQRYYNPFDIWFLPEDPALKAYLQLSRQYGKDDFVIVAFREPRGIFADSRTPELIVDLSERLERTRFVQKVDSLSTYQYIRGGVNKAGEEELSVEDFIKRSSLIHYTPAGLRAAWPHLAALTEAEGLHGHREAARVRLDGPRARGDD